MLPHGIKLQTDDMVSRQIKRQKEKDKQQALKRVQEEKFEKQKQKIEAAAKKRQEAEMLRQQRVKEK